MIKILETGEVELPVQKYGPDGDYEQTEKEKPKITLLNTNNNHFNLIVKK